MDWSSPYSLILLPWALLVLLWAYSRSDHPMSQSRRRALLAVRSVGVVLAVLALAGPAWYVTQSRRAVIFVVDQSQSLGEKGTQQARQWAERQAARLPGDTHIGFITVAKQSVLRGQPEPGRTHMTKVNPQNNATTDDDDAGAQTNLAEALRLVRGLFPAGASRRIVLVSDGMETQGDARAARARPPRRVSRSMSIPSRAIRVLMCASVAFGPVDRACTRGPVSTSMPRSMLR